MVSIIGGLALPKPHLYQLCDEAEIKRFCTHTLRHTHAAWAAESFAKASGTRQHQDGENRYVPVTDDSPSKATQQFERNQST